MPCLHRSTLLIPRPNGNVWDPPVWGAFRAAGPTPVMATRRSSRASSRVRRAERRFWLVPLTKTRRRHRSRAFPQVSESSRDGAGTDAGAAPGF
jgi:hypothetical protein